MPHHPPEGFFVKHLQDVLSFDFFFSEQVPVIFFPPWPSCLTDLYLFNMPPVAINSKLPLIREFNSSLIMSTCSLSLSSSVVFFPLNSTGYFCKCPASFMGTHCEIGISPCASNPCLYGGTCVPRADDFYCQCRGQYSGQRYFNLDYKALMSCWQNDCLYTLYPSFYI